MRCKQKFLALLLAVALVLAMSSTALADDNVCKIGDKEYLTLQEAVNAVADDTASGDIILTADITEEDVIISSGNITLDLNGHTITNQNDHTITVKIDAILTINDNSTGGTVDNVTHAKAAIWNEGTVILNGGSYTRSQEKGLSSSDAGGNSYYALVNHGTMTINEGVSVTQDGNFSSMIENGYYSYSSGNATNGYIAGTNYQNPTLTINGGNFSGGLNTVKNDDGGILTINGGTFQNASQAVVQNHNEATINGGTFTTSNVGVYAVDNCGCAAEHDKGTLTITNGTFTANIAVYDRSNQSTAKVNITGGTFNETEAAIKKENSQATITVSGGTFSTDVKEYLAPGLELVMGADEKYVVKKASSHDDDDDGSIGYPPAILSPTGNQVVAVMANGTVTLSVDATGVGFGGYQWYVNRGDGQGFVPVAGATGASLTLYPTFADNGSQYYCRVRNGYGYVDSGYFTLSVVGGMVPKTGDQVSVTLWVCLMALGVAGAAAVLARRRSR